jgi:large subunit ribosomal protein L13
MRVVDASGMVLGRFCARVAKRLLEGDDIIVVNAEKAIIVGSREAILRRYFEKRRRGSPLRGPFYPRMPDRLLKRTVRGMLNYKRKHGRDAYKRLRVYLGVPAQFSAMEHERWDAKDLCKVPRAYITLEELARKLGAKL